MLLCSPQNVVRHWSYSLFNQRLNAEGRMTDNITHSKKKWKSESASKQLHGVMLFCCQWGIFYKVFFALVLAVIVLEYLLGSFLVKRWEIPYKSSRVFERPFQHHLLTGYAGGENISFGISPANATSAPSAATNATLFDSVRDDAIVNTTAIPVCPNLPPNLHGRVSVIKSPVPSVFGLEQRYSWLQPGGHWEPQSCKALKKVAIVVPFRSRGEQLLLFLQHMHPFLRKQQIDYTIFVVEQDGRKIFNRAMLMNVGFVEALKVREFDCFIFHDVDLLPEDDRNLYTCPEQPRHMSVAVDKLKYRLPYKRIFGGVSAISTAHFRLLNGFSNMFWGWGAEDDDMSNRIRYHKLHISRYSIDIARYTMLKHKREKPSPNRRKVLKSGRTRYDTEGLNSLKYLLKEFKQNFLYTWLLVELDSLS